MDKHRTTKIFCLPGAEKHTLMIVKTPSLLISFAIIVLQRSHKERQCGAKSINWCLYANFFCIILIIYSLKAFMVNTDFFLELNFEL